MKKADPPPLRIRSVEQYHQLTGLPPAEHPLLSVIEVACPANPPELPGDSMVMGLYNIFLKKNIDGAILYGRRQFDFSNGVMGFALPDQLFSFNTGMDFSKISGWMLLVHPDFVRNHPIKKRMDELNFFSYNINEALHLSPREEALVDRILRDIRDEYRQPIDAFSRDVIISHMEVLLNYATRFYNRQFITRSNASGEPLLRFEQVLNRLFAADDLETIPTVHDVASEMNVSAHYLGDMLRSQTGLNAQQHIHNRIIEKAKGILLSTNLSVNETAYRLGFEYPQYFNRLFRTKTGQTPAAFRKNISGN